MRVTTSGLQKAITELQQRTLHDIQCETAKTWTLRACAAAILGLHSDAREYAHEGIEHAALCGDDELLTSVRAMLAAHNVVV